MKDGAARELEERWANMHAAGFEAQLAAGQNRLRAQKNDISAFIKLFKEVFDRWYKGERKYTGSIWAGRVYGSIELVTRLAFEFGWCFKAKSVGGRGLVGLPLDAGAALLGWKLAAKDAAEPVPGFSSRCESIDVSKDVNAACTRKGSL